jgi:hypothetical protein
MTWTLLVFIVFVLPCPPYLLTAFHATPLLQSFHLLRTWDDPTVHSGLLMYEHNV